MKLNCKSITQVRSGGGCCGCFAFANSLENRKQYIRLLNSIYTPQESGVQYMAIINCVKQVF